MILSFMHSVVLNHKSGQSTQHLEIVVKYDQQDDSVDDVEVYVYENGKRLCEISTLLDKAEGCPLNKMLMAVNWREMARDKKHAEPMADES
jgi:hypothetical protein